VRNLGGESEAAWRALLDDLVARGLATPELLIVDGSSGLDKALAALWPAVRECQFSCVREFHGGLSSTDRSRQTLGKEDGELRVGGAPFDSWFPMNAEIPQRQIEQFGGGFV
jgi:hypothetical protein